MTLVRMCLSTLRGGTDPEEKNATCQQITFQWGLWKLYTPGVSFFLGACAMQEPERCTRSNLARSQGWGTQPFAWSGVLLSSPALRKQRSQCGQQDGALDAICKNCPHLFGSFKKIHRRYKEPFPGDLNSWNAPWKLGKLPKDSTFGNSLRGSLFWPSDPW